MCSSISLEQQAFFFLPSPIYYFFHKLINVKGATDFSRCQQFPKTKECRKQRQSWCKHTNKFSKSVKKNKKCPLSVSHRYGRPRAFFKTKNKYDLAENTI